MNDGLCSLTSQSDGLVGFIISPRWFSAIIALHSSHSWLSSFTRNFIPATQSKSLRQPRGMSQDRNFKAPNEKVLPTDGAKRSSQNSQQKKENHEVVDHVRFCFSFGALCVICRFPIPIASSHAAGMAFVHVRRASACWSTSWRRAPQAPCGLPRLRHVRRKWTVRRKDVMFLGTGFEIAFLIELPFL